MTLGTLFLNAAAAAPRVASEFAEHAHRHGHASCHHHPILFALGVLAVLIFTGRLIARLIWRRRFGGGGPRGGHWGRRGRYGRNPLHRLFMRLDTSPSQEQVIREAVDSVRGQGRALADGLHVLRTDLSRSVEGEVFSPEAFDAILTSRDEELNGMRAAIRDAFAKVHEALTPAQRRELAALLASRGGMRFGFRL